MQRNYEVVKRLILNYVSRILELTIDELKVDDNPLATPQPFPIFREIKDGKPTILVYLKYTNGRCLLISPRDFQSLIEGNSIPDYVEGANWQFGYYWDAMHNFFLPMQNRAGLPKPRLVQANLNELKYRMFAPFFAETVYPFDDTNLWQKNVFAKMDEDAKDLGIY